MRVHRLTIFIIVLLLIALITSCRREQAQSGNRPTPSNTPTPLSTPLNALATQIPPGIQGNPLQMVIYSPSPSTATSAATRFERALLEYGLVVEILVRDRYAELLAALCDSNTGTVSVVWLDGITYAAARALNCGVPIMQVQRGEDDEATTGRAVQIVVSSSLGITNVASLRETNFCRISYSDYYSWVVPSLVFSAFSLNPLTAFETITDYEDEPTMLAAVAEGTCDAAAAAEGTLDDSDYNDIIDDIRIIETSVPIPYGILMYPVAVPLGTRVQLTNALTELAEDTQMAGTLRALIRQDALVPIEPGDLDEFDDFIDVTGFDFAQMAQ